MQSRTVDGYGFSLRGFQGRALFGNGSWCSEAGKAPIPVSLFSGFLLLLPVAT